MSLLEAMLSVAIVALLAASAFQVFPDHHGAIKLTKLSSDVASINHAIAVYRANGGSLSEFAMNSTSESSSNSNSTETPSKTSVVLKTASTDPEPTQTDSTSTTTTTDSSKTFTQLTVESQAQAILDKMKTKRADGATYAGFRGAMLDKRLSIQMQTTEEAARGEPRAVWNGEKLRFDIVSTGVPGIAKFILNDAMAATDFGAEERNSGTIEYNSANGWIWAYEDDASPNLPIPTAVAASGSSTGPSPGGTDDGTDSLLPPTFSPGGGSFDYSQFPLTIFLSNPNPATSSWIMVSTGGAYSQYNGSFTIPPDTIVKAFVSGDPEVWENSKVATSTFTAGTSMLQAPTITPSSPRFDNSNPEVLVTLTDPNPSAIAKLVYWLSGQSTPIDYTSPFILRETDHPDGVTVFAKAVGLTSYSQDSIPVSSAIAKSDPEKLTSPQIALSDTAFNDSVTSITVTLTNPNVPGASELLYAVKAPAAGYPPVSTYQLYSGPFAISSVDYPEGFHVRAYARSLDPGAYADSDFAEALTVAEFFDVALNGDVVIVLDASGSMSGRFANMSRFERVVQEAIDAINALGPTQKFSVITFNSGLHWSDGSNDLQLATPENKQAAVNGLLSLTSGGSTNYEVGLNYAATLATLPDQVVFLSDGLPNERNYIDELNTLVSLGITVDTIGIGNSSSQAPLQEMANLSGGGFSFVAEPGSSGTLRAPSFSEDGDRFDHDEFPIQLTLTDPNTGAPSRLRYSLNGGASLIYSGPITVTYNTTVEAFAESTDPSWAPSSHVSEVYSVSDYQASKPGILLSDSAFTDSVSTVAVTLTDNNPAGLTNLVYWYGSQSESDAVAYTGPFTLSAADWNTYAGETVREIELHAKSVGAESFVKSSSTEDEDLENQTTAFYANLKKTPLYRPKVAPEGGKFDHDEFPLSVMLVNPNGAGQIQVSVNGAGFSPYSGPISVGYDTELEFFVKASGPGTGGYRSSEVISELYEVRDVELNRPSANASDDEFDEDRRTITVTLTNPNSPALSNIIYWFDGQDETTQAVTYTGPITLSANDWETYVKAGQDKAKLCYRAVGMDSFVKDSSLGELRFENDD